MTTENKTMKIREYIFSEIGFIILILGMVGAIIYPIWQTKIEVAVINQQLSTLNKVISDHIIISKDTDNTIANLDKRISIIESKK
jgi:hypothetical protein